jgi:endo-1,4-beta-xylanase
MNMSHFMDRRAFLASVGALTGAAPLALRGGYVPSWLHAGTAGLPLRARAQAKGLLYGSSTLARYLRDDHAFEARFAEECGILVPEWELKWEAIRPAPDRFDFTAPDFLAAFAAEHSMAFRGHCLAWHESLPPWFAATVNRSNAETFLRKHIATVAGRYAGKVHSWDVVNEAIDVGGGRPDSLRASPWLDFLGPDYIRIAFEATAEADPHALLCYNEYGIEFKWPKEQAKRAAVLELLGRLKSSNVPVQALGIQAHLRAGDPGFSADELATFLRRVADLGLKILITELDADDRALPKDPATRDQAVAKTYESFLSVALAEPAVIAVLTWGLSDRYTYFNKMRPRADGAPARPLPLDADLKPKPAYDALARAFDAAPARPGTGAPK